LLLILSAIGCNFDKNATGIGITKVSAYAAEVAIFEDKRSTDTDVLKAYYRAARREQHDSREEAQTWIRLANDVKQSSAVRGLAFVLFWQRCAHPTAPVNHIVASYGLQTWFSPQTVIDVSEASQTPIDDVRFLHHREWSFFELMVTPDSWIAFDVWLAVSPIVTREELLRAASGGGNGDVTITAIRVSPPTDD
jgi:hypothetical protein